MVSGTIAARKLNNLYSEVRALNTASQIIHQGIHGQHIISAANEERNQIKIVLLQS
jgi:outer membrane murein-binding lipoprotein Lpp